MPRFLFVLSMRAELRFAMSECAGSTVWAHAVYELEAELGLVLEGVLVDAVRVEVEHGVVEVHVLDLVVLLGWITEGDMPAVVVHGSPRPGGVPNPTQTEKLDHDAALAITVGQS